MMRSRMTWKIRLRKTRAGYIDVGYNTPEPDDIMQI